MKISSGTIARTVVLVLALVNQVLSMLGYKIIPIEDEQVNDFITMLFTIGSALAAWWKNNSFTEAAIEGDKYKDIVKEQQNEHN
jgi:SPP1 family holin